MRVVLSFPLLSTLLRVSATKHSFTTMNDSRSFIGPIGAPFGFRVDGEFTLKILDFEVGQGKGQKSSSNEIDELYPGLLLMRFETTSDFAEYADMILDDQSICSFSQFLKDGEDNALKEEDSEDCKPFIVNETEAALYIPMKKAEAKCFSHNFGRFEVGQYFLMYQLCPPDSKSVIPKNVRSKIELDFTFKNYDRFGNTSYLTAGEMPLPHIFLYFSISYCILTFFWIQNSKAVMSGKEGWFDGGEKPTVHAIHHLMSLVLVLKTLSTFFESVRYHFIRVNGHAELWSFAYYFFTFLRGTFLFTVLLLLGSGWSLYKPFLNPKEKIIIFVVLILQSINNIALIVLNSETEGERFYNDWSATLHLFDILCCFAVLLPIVWQINALEEAGDCDKDGESARTLAKLHLFRSFYLLVIGYIYFSRVAIFLFASTLNYKLTWMRYCFTEVATLAFYITIGMKFRPKTENLYAEVFKDDNEYGDNATIPSIEIEMMPDEI